MSDKLSYNANELPKPLTNPDAYSVAQLVEMRAIRQSLQRLVELLEKQLAPVETPVVKVSKPVEISSKSK